MAPERLKGTLRSSPSSRLKYVYRFTKTIFFNGKGEQRELSLPPTLPKTSFFFFWKSVPSDKSKFSFENRTTRDHGRRNVQSTAIGPVGFLGVMIRVVEKPKNGYWDEADFVSPGLRMNRARRPCLGFMTSAERDVINGQRSAG